MTAYTRGMSTARQADRRAPAAPRVTRTSIFPRGACPSPTAAFPAVSLPATAFAGWRDRTPTEALAATAAAYPRRGPSRRTRSRRHLRRALTGTLLAIVAITGLSAYAAAGVTDARPTAPCQACITCR